MNQNRLKYLIVLLVPLFLMRDAYAYLDPGTGSFVLQMLLGMIVALGMAAKVFWSRLKALFSFSDSGGASEELQTVEQSESGVHNEPPNAANG